MQLKRIWAWVGLVLVAAVAPCRAEDPPSPRHNVILFVADGLRHGAVDTGAMPTFAEVRKNGVDFVNSHSLYPTVTTPNGSAIATGHYLGDTGNYSNDLYLGYPLRDGDPAHAVENNIHIADMDAHFEGNYLGETSLIAAARQAGWHTAIIGKHGPALVQDVTRNDKGVTAENVGTIVIDDATGVAVARNGERIGVPLPADFSRRLANDPYFKATYFENTVPAGDPRTPGRTANSTSGTKVANVPQQKYLIDVLTRAVLPGFVDPAGDKKPFVVVYWSRDPDGTQHAQVDAADKLVPGINGPTVRAAFVNVDNNLKQLVAYLRATADPGNPGKKLAETTDIFITSDHGFSTVSRGTVDTAGGRVESFAIKQRYADVRAGQTPPGLVAMDLAHDLDLPLYDGDKVDMTSDPALYQYRKLKLTGTEGAGNWAEHPSGVGLLGGKGTYSKEKGYDASLMVVGRAVYVPSLGKEPADAGTREFIRKAVASLAAQPYNSGVFVDTERFGAVPGALSLSDINLKGSALTPVPAIVVNPRTFSTDPANPTMTGVIFSEGYREGGGTHGSFGRADTYNCMIAFGPDFKSSFADPDPVSNADIAQTLAHITGVKLNANARGKLVGRVMAEALASGPAPRGSKALTKASEPAAGGIRTYLQYQEYSDDAGMYLYFDTAGFPGATVGLTVK